MLVCHLPIGILAILIKSECTRDFVFFFIIWARVVNMLANILMDFTFKCLLHYNTPHRSNKYRLKKIKGQTLREKSHLKLWTLGDWMGGICIWDGNGFLIGKTGASIPLSTTKLMDSWNGEGTTPRSSWKLNPSRDGTREYSPICPTNALHISRKEDSGNIMCCMPPLTNVLYTKKRFSRRLISANERFGSRKMHWSKDVPEQSYWVVQHCTMCNKNCKINCTWKIHQKRG